MLETIRGLFYGDNWYIWWGIVLIPFVIKFAIQVPKFIKSVKQRKKRVGKLM